MKKVYINIYIDKHIIHLTFEVPKVDVLRRIDEKEGA